MDISKSQLSRIQMRTTESESASSTTTLMMILSILSSLELRILVSLKEFSLRDTSFLIQMITQNSTLGEI